MSEAAHVLICPNCQSRYKVAQPIGPPGRRVRCGRCTTVWFFVVEPDELDQSVHGGNGQAATGLADHIDHGAGDHGAGDHGAGDHGAGDHGAGATAHHGGELERAGAYGEPWYPGHATDTPAIGQGTDHGDHAHAGQQGYFEPAPRDHQPQLFPGSINGSTPPSDTATGFDQAGFDHGERRPGEENQSWMAGLAAEIQQEAFPVSPATTPYQEQQSVDRRETGPAREALPRMGETQPNLVWPFEQRDSAERELSLPASSSSMPSPGFGPALIPVPISQGGDRHEQPISPPFQGTSSYAPNWRPAAVEAAGERVTGQAPGGRGSLDPFALSARMANQTAAPFGREPANTFAAQPPKSMLPPFRLDAAPVHQMDRSPGFENPVEPRARNRRGEQVEPRNRAPTRNTDSAVTVREPARPMPEVAQPRGMAEFVVSMLMLVLALSITGFILLDRLSVVRAIPGMARIYAGIGLAVDARGLQIRNVKTQWNRESETAELEIKGEVFNSSGLTQVVPTVVLAFLDQSGATLFHWSGRTGSSTVSVGGFTRFTVVVPTPPRAATNILVRFAKIE